MSRYILIAAVVTCLACSDASGPAATFSGDYKLRTVGMTTLPYTVAFGGHDSVRYLSGEIRTLPNNHYSRDVVYQSWQDSVFEIDTMYYSDSTSFYRQVDDVIEFFRVVQVGAGPMDSVETFQGALSNDRSTLTVLTLEAGDEIPSVFKR